MMLKNNFKFSDYKKILIELEKILLKKAYYNIALENKYYSNGDLENTIVFYIDSNDAQKNNIRQNGHEYFHTLEEFDKYLTNNIPNYKSIYDKSKTFTVAKRTSRTKTSN